MKEGRFNRRTAVAVLAGAASAAILAGCSKKEADTDPNRETSKKPKRSFDPHNAQHNVDAYVRIVADARHGAESFGWVKGRVFGVAGDRERIRPLLDYEGFSCARTNVTRDGSIQILKREVGYFRDLATGTILERWRNPYTEEDVAVVPVHNDPVNAVIAPTMKVGDQSMPFLLNWTLFGDDAFCNLDANQLWKNPLSPVNWPRESSGEALRVSDYIQWRVSRSDLDDPGLDKIRMSGAWTRIEPWQPWMLMGAREGHLLYRSNIRGLSRIEELPADLLNYTEKHYPRFMSAPKEYYAPNVSAFEVYAREQKPEKLETGGATIIPEGGAPDEAAGPETP